ncbi:MAG TPA: glycosyltransferase family 4 protein [Gemmatimonadales bacterium]|nr:glycosyltransferase family 4 protein [Gemmatimonadales bacterium]
MHLDPAGRTPDELLRDGWRDFGRTAAAARRAGAQVTMIQAAWQDGDGEFDGVPCFFVAEPGQPLIRLPGGRAILRRPRRLLERVRALAPGLIHFDGIVYPRALRALAATVPDVPIIVQDHGTKCPRGWRRWWYRWGFAPIAGVTFTARPQIEPFTQAGVLRTDLPVFEVIEGSSPFTPGDREAARSAAGMEGDPCLLWAGNLDANKDPLMVLDAVSRAARETPGLRLYMCFRHASLLDAVHARIASDSVLVERVRLLGAVPYPKMETLLRAADFLVQASHVEGSGYVLIEALACGTTPLVTDIPSFRRITGNGRFGALTPIGDAAALAHAIRDWSRRDRAALRRGAREHFERELSFDAIGAQLYAAYTQVLSRQ